MSADSDEPSLIQYRSKRRCVVEREKKKKKEWWEEEDVLSDEEDLGDIGMYLWICELYWTLP